jgi:hypothetical protein
MNGSGPQLEQPALDVFYHNERTWGRAALWLSTVGCTIGIVSNEYRAAACLLILSIGCQLISWRAMRAAQHLEQQRIARLTRGEAS